MDDEFASVELVSVDDAKPSDDGGAIARNGFNYQDEIAVSFLIQMLEDECVVSVHCETHDDIVVVIEDNESATKIAEFVQVKAGEPDKLLSFSDLCKRENGKVGSSIFERSFARDRYEEISRFRVVTLRPVVKELKVITFPLDSVGRINAAIELQQLKDKIQNRFPELKSKKGNGTSYWPDNCVWDERHSDKAVRDSNLVQLLRLSASENRGLLQELADILLDELRAMAKKAGDAKWLTNSDQKIITRKELRDWWERRTQEVADEASAPSGGKLRTKMLEVGLPEDLIELAVGLRREYSADARIPRYMELEEGSRLQSQVKAEVISLRARYVANQLDVDGIGFHALCVDQMDVINSQRAEGTENRSAYLKGCMYDITDRCLLRFSRPEQ